MKNRINSLKQSLDDLKEPSSFYHGARATLEVKINNIVIFRRNKKELIKTTSMQAHGRFMLVVCLGGDGFIRVAEQKEIHLTPGLGTLLPSHIPHLHHDMSHDHDWLFITFQSEATAYSSLHSELFEIPESVYSDILQFSQDSLAGQSEMNKRCVILRLELILSSLSKQIIPETKLEHGTHGFVEEVVDYINRHIAGHIDIASIAERFGVSSGYLRLRFKEFGKHSLGRFITLRKFEHAQTLLSDRKMSVQEVASACGFKSISTFCRRFKEITGVTPKDYRHRFPN